MKILLITLLGLSALSARATGMEELEDHLFRIERQLDGIDDKLDELAEKLRPAVETERSYNEPRDYWNHPPLGYRYHLISSGRFKGSYELLKGASVQ